MLREYQLENFKAFAGPETIPIRPITLIYGPNSSGKSSILQSLLLLKQTLEEANDATPLLPRGKLVDLGDYHEFVHRHDVSKKFSFQVSFDLNAKNVQPLRARKLLEAANPQEIGLQVTFAAGEDIILPSSIEVFIGNRSLPVIVYEPELARLFNVLEPHGLHTLKDWNTLLTKYSLPSDLTPWATVQVREINSEHTFWQTWWAETKNHVDRELSESQATYAYREQGDRKYWEYISDRGGEEEIKELLKGYSFENAIEDFKNANQSLALGLRHFLPDEVRGVPHANSPLDVRVFYRDLKEGPSSAPEAQLDISPVSFHICSLFRQFISSIVYLGPLRSYPERDYIFSGNVSEYVGRSGEMLPGVLFWKGPEFLDQINADLARLGVGYKLEVKRSSDRGNGFALHLKDEKSNVSANLRDVGFGVSQVLPIIVQSLLSQNKTLLIEQPEIHLHPALQAELGDLFIQSALGEQKNTFILETHSEHLMLRILRRIRETTEDELEPGLTPIRPEDVAVLYVLPGKDSTKVIEIPIRPDGEFAKRWPEGFFTDRAKELF